MLLPDLARKYAAAEDSKGDRVAVQFNESWYGCKPDDWCCFQNRGADLDDCTLLVEIKGAAGQVRKNVHYAKHWPAQAWLYARYRPGFLWKDRRVANQSVPDVDSVDVTVLSPRFSTQLHYVYAGAEKDKQVATLCQNMKLTWRYQPFAKAILFSDTQRGVKLTLADYPYLGKCKVNVRFRCGAEVKGWQWELDSWKQGEEKTFETPAGQLAEDPDTIEVLLSFPRTNYQPHWTWKISG